MTHELRFGSEIRSSANIVFQAPLPGGSQLVVFQDRRGDWWPYVISTVGATGEAMSVAEGLLASL